MRGIRNIFSAFSYNSHNQYTHTMGKVKNSIHELREEAQELIDLGDSHEKREGYGMMKVIDALSEPKIPMSAEDVSVGETIYRMGELRYLIEGTDDDDQICIETIDLETGDTQDLYPMYVDVIDGIKLTDGSIVREVRFCQRPNVQQEGEPEFDNDYFKIIHRGWCKASQREEIQIHAGQHGNIILYQDGDKLGFIIDVYGENDIADTMTVWEDDLNPEEESDAPENFSLVEIEDFKDEWGQFHDEICAELGVPDSNDADDILMVDYFWLPTDNKWFPKNASTYSKREEAIADYLKLG